MRTSVKTSSNVHEKNLDLFQNSSPVVYPPWADGFRGIPNSLARSSLFSVSDKRRERTYLKDRKITTIGGADITYNGLELRQDDADVFLQIIHLSRMQPVDKPVTFTKFAMIKALKWSSCSSSYERLRDTIIRLTVSALVVDDKVCSCSVRLIDKFVSRNELTGTDNVAWAVWLDPKMIAMFSWNAYSRVEWDTRLKLNSMGKWLHSYYSSHKIPKPIKISTLEEGCGANYSDEKYFKRHLIESLNILIDVGFIKSFDVTAGLVTVIKGNNKALLN